MWGLQATSPCTGGIQFRKLVSEVICREHGDYMPTRRVRKVTYNRTALPALSSSKSVPVLWTAPERRQWPGNSETPEEARCSGVKKEVFPSLEYHHLPSSPPPFFPHPQVTCFFSLFNSSIKVLQERCSKPQKALALNSLVVCPRPAGWQLS